MDHKDYCEQFDLIEFVRKFSEQLDPFSLQLEDKQIDFLAPGILQFQPKKHSNKYLLLSAGVHGNETAPIEIVNDLVKQIFKGELELELNLLVIIGNPRAMLFEQRFTGYNLNRLFNGEWKNHLDNEAALYEAQRAELIEKVAERFYHSHLMGMGAECYHYDLHTAIKPSLHQKFAIYPYLEERKHCTAQMKFLLDAGVDTILLAHKPATTFSYYTSHNFKAHAFTVELGKVKPFGQNNRDDFKQAEHTLSNLISDQYCFDKDADISGINLYQVKKELLRTSEMDELAFDSANTANFTQFAQGTLLLDAGKHSYLTEEDGEAIVFPNNKVPVGQRMCLVVVKK